MNLLDHIVLAAGDLECACKDFERTTGITPVYGGKHANQLSHNALVSIGQDLYLEIFAPLPGISDGHHWIRACHTFRAPRVLSFCLRALTTLEDAVNVCKKAGISGMGPAEWSRKTTSGDELTWRLFYPEDTKYEIALPFFIDWLDSTHPSKTSPGGIKLMSIDIKTPHKNAVVNLYNEFGFQPSSVTDGDDTKLCMTLKTPNGIITYS
ncbi:MAG: VOC family protein [Pseudomonadota bacterium]